MFRLAILLLMLALAAPAMCAEAKWPDGYTLYRGDPAAASPDGRYDVIVPSEAGYEKGERCKLVDKKAGTIVGTIEHGYYWQDPDTHPSHASLSAQWAKAGDGWLCLALFDGKWEPQDLALLSVGNGAYAETDLWDLIQKETTKAFNGKIPDHAYNDQIGFVLAETAVKLVDAGHVEVKATADSNPKEDGSRTRYTCPVTLTYDVAAKKLALTTGKLEVQKAEPAGQ